MHFGNVHHTATDVNSSLFSEYPAREVVFKNDFLYGYIKLTPVAVFVDSELPQAPFSREAIAPLPPK